jgi:hypothetical protein
MPGNEMPLQPWLMLVREYLELYQNHLGRADFESLSLCGRSHPQFTDEKQHEYLFSE